MKIVNARRIFGAMVAVGLCASLCVAAPNKSAKASRSSWQQAGRVVKDIKLAKDAGLELDAEFFYLVNQVFMRFTKPAAKPAAKS